jgi:hypothetical protein
VIGQANCAPNMLGTIRSAKAAFVPPTKMEINTLQSQTTTSPGNVREPTYPAKKVSGIPTATLKSILRYDLAMVPIFAKQG